MRYVEWQTRRLMGYISIGRVGRLSGKFTGDWSGKYVQPRVVNGVINGPLLSRVVTCKWSGKLSVKIWSFVSAGVDKW